MILGDDGGCVALSKAKAVVDLRRVDSGLDQVLQNQGRREVEDLVITTVAVHAG